MSAFYPYVFFSLLLLWLSLSCQSFFLTVSRSALLFPFGIDEADSPLFFGWVSLWEICGSEGKACVMATGRQLRCGFYVKQRRNSGGHYRTLTIFIPWNIQAALYPVSTQPSVDPDAAILKATCEHMIAWQTEPPWDSSPSSPFFIEDISVWWAFKPHVQRLQWGWYIWWDNSILIPIQM